MSTPDPMVAAASPLTPEQTFNLLVESQEQLRQREAELLALQQQQDQTKTDVIKAELQQGDNFTKRARPMVVYAGLLFIFLNYVFIPTLCHLAGQPLGNGGVLELPSDFWLAWGGIVATWSIGRSFEKTGASNRVTQLITASKAPAPAPARSPAAGSNDGAVG
jgi:hypothetical protein